MWGSNHNSVTQYPTQGKNHASDIETTVGMYQVDSWVIVLGLTNLFT